MLGVKRHTQDGLLDIGLPGTAHQEEQCLSDRQAGRQIHTKVLAQEVM